YNVELEGVARALRDPGVIPRDGSVAVTVVTFAGGSTVAVPFREIDSAPVADAIAEMVENLKCTTTTCNSTGLCPVFGTNPASNYGPAISGAYNELRQNHRAGARQVLLMSSDGQPTDPCDAILAAKHVSQAAKDLSIPFEIDLILLNFDAQQASVCRDTGEKIDQIVFPQPASDLPGATLVIEKGVCNKPCASLTDDTVRGDCVRQVVAFAERTRDVIRSPVAKIEPLVVNTEADPDPNTPLSGNSLSLRQAIEQANCRGGSATITFECNVTTIRPRAPLPALTSPEIVIDGIAGRGGGKCGLVTIDGSMTQSAKCEEQRDDGLLIRSNRDGVRGLKISGFQRAGIGIEPTSAADNTGFNRIELNTLERNTKAGVCVIDPSQAPARAVSHNIGNTISMNNISGSETPIDLACDGPTPNDPGDLDEGPNTLLNFPDDLRVANSLDIGVTASGVSLAGKLSGPTTAGAIVEIFAITGFRTGPGGRAIDGVMFLAQTKADANGSFLAAGLSDSPTCGYTATVTDIAGNTSELMLSGGGFARAKVTNLDFEDLAVPNQNPQTRTFTIENTGFGPLVVRFVSIRRDDFPKEGELGDDRSHFSIQSPVVGSAQTITVQTGQKQTFTALFDPAIPAVFTGKNRKLPASLVLPDTVNSTLTLEHNGCSGSDSTVKLTGHVSGKVRLIHPDSPRNDPQVKLERSGDELRVTFSVFDSDLDVNKVNYEFFKTRDGLCNTSEPPVPAEISDRDLTKVISGRGLVKGRSFTATQRFTGANDNPEVGCVRVTVSDGRQNIDCATSLPASGPSVCASFATQNLRRSQVPSILRKPVKPDSWHRMLPAVAPRARTSRGKIDETNGSRKAGGSLRGPLRLQQEDGRK
ncbi:MAG TPA: hypothetical protein VGL29_05180, partial [Blastocatellia bacterium]